MTEYGKTLQPIEQGQSGSSNQWKIRYLYRRLASTIANYGDFLCATKKLSMAVQFKKNNVIEDDEDGLHVQYQSISYEHSWKSLEEYVVNVLKQSAGLLLKKRYTAWLWETRNWVPNPFVNMYKLSCPCSISISFQ